MRWRRPGLESSAHGRVAAGLAAWRFRRRVRCFPRAPRRPGGAPPDSCFTRRVVACGFPERKPPMRPTLACFLASALLAGSTGAHAVTVDPYLWLEDVEGDKALDWVRAQNAQSQKVLATDPAFETLRSDLRAILDSDARIPDIDKLVDYFYNFWRDKKNPAGVWRRTTLAEFRKPAPQWEVLIDLDALNAAEGVTWVWHGVDCLKPEARHCLVSLSRPPA